MSAKFNRTYKGGCLVHTLITIVIAFSGGVLSIPLFILFENTFLEDSMKLILPFSLSILVLFIIVSFFENNKLDTLGIKNNFILKDLFLGAIIAFFVISFIMFVLLITNSVNISLTYLNTHILFNVLLMFVGFAIQSTGEELFYRGYLQTRLTFQYNNLFAIVVSSVVFTVTHILNPNITYLGVLNIFLAGVFLALMYKLSGSIWLSSGFHIIWNFMQPSLLGINVSGMKLGDSIFVTEYNNINILNGGMMGAEGSIILTIILIAMIVVLSIRIPKNMCRF